jgi:hypothetical protein
MTSIQILYAALMALGILISISVALTLSIEGAGALYVRNQIRLLLERSRVLSLNRTPSTGQHSCRDPDRGRAHDRAPLWPAQTPAARGAAPARAAPRCVMWINPGQIAQPGNQFRRRDRRRQGQRRSDLSPAQTGTAAVKSSSSPVRVSFQGG